ncbi:Hypothetical predicted protein [Marmota monax]|uniref:Uncharacterized protein n=1 Tax=Marmota monax TaxID=9995 RepID=A0A5E4BSJ8_MARMO|nr:Hypothetical predicted protein [Marmota monax]
MRGCSGVGAALDKCGRRGLGVARSPLPGLEVGLAGGGAAPEPPPSSAPLRARTESSAATSLAFSFTSSPSAPPRPAPARPGRYRRAGSAALRFRLAAGKKPKGGAGGGHAAMHIHQGARGRGGGSWPSGCGGLRVAGAPRGWVRVLGGSLVFVSPGGVGARRGRACLGAAPAWCAFVLSDCASAVRHGQGAPPQARGRGKPAEQPREDSKPIIMLKVQNCCCFPTSRHVAGFNFARPRLFSCKRSLEMFLTA